MNKLPVAINDGHERAAIADQDFLLLVTARIKSERHRACRIDRRIPKAAKWQCGNRNGCDCCSIAGIHPHAPVIQKSPERHHTG